MMMTAVTLSQIGDMQPGRPSLHKATTGAKTSERLVSKANNNLPVQPLQSKNIIHSMDDSGVYFVSGVNSFQAIVPLTGQEKGVLFLGGCISLKNRSCCPLLRASTSPFKSTCLLIKLKEQPFGLYCRNGQR
jgi:hypothetical protein